MRVLILSNKALGFYKFRRELLENLLSDNEVILAFPNEEIKSAFVNMGCEYIDVDIDRRGTNPLKDLMLAMKYERIIREKRPDIVLSYTIKPNVYGGIACRLTKTKYIPNITGLGSSLENGGLIQKIATTLYKCGVKKAECVFFQNAQNAMLFKERKLYSGRYKVIPGSGVNLDDYVYVEYPADDDPIRFLFVGRIMKEKGIEETVTAFREVHNLFPNTVLNIVGDMDENYAEYLRSVECEFIKYHGEQIDVKPFYREAHCVVLPSYHEGTSNVLLEAAASGRPVISTSVPGCQETFDEGVTGFGCDPRDAAGLYECMKKFLEMPYEKRKQMGISGREKIEKEFDRKLVVNAYLEEIKRAVEG